MERPTPERLRQALGEFEDTMITTIEELSDGTQRQHDVVVVQMLDGHLLARLASRGVLDLKQISAANRFLNDCHAAGILSGAVIDPGRIVVDGGNSMPHQEREADAYGKVHSILARVSPITKMVLIDIVLFEMTREAFARKHGFGRKDEKDTALAINSKIQDALTDLDFRYYGRQEARGGHSHVEGYRPSIYGDER